MLSIYKASAGSGKTFTLAYEYIKLLLGHRNPDGKYILRTKNSDKHRNILAITFTNKATEVMKERIVQELSALAKSQQTQYQKRLITEFGCTPQQLQEAAEKALHNLLFDFNFFNISTIDSFFQTILRTFAREAELTGDYELELNNDEAIAEGMHRFFESLNRSNDKEIRRYIASITDYLLESIRNNEGVMLFSQDSYLHKNLLQNISGLSNDTFEENYEALKEYFSDAGRIEQISTAITQHISKLKNEAASLCTTALHALDSVPCKGNPIHSNILKLLDAGRRKQFKPSQTLATLLANGTPKYSAGFAKFLAANPDYPAPDDEIMDAAHAVERVTVTMPLLSKIRANFFMLALMVKIYAYIEEYRVENNALLLSDTNSLLHSIIGNEDTPFIYERLGVILNHYLIDEFQDTSTIQWDCLRPLVSNGVATGSDSLIIGDEKQCIYRFRNSDPTLLGNKVSTQITDNFIFGTESENNTNWRSSKDVIEFNNTLFDTLARQRGFADIYANVRQNISLKHINHRGYIEVTPVDAEKAADYDETVLPSLADDIDRQLGAGYKPRDIAVLVRKKADGEKAISYLIEHQTEGRYKYNIISDDLMPVSNSPAVRMIISTLQNIAYPFQDETGSKYKSRRETKSLMARFEIALHSGNTPNDALMEALRTSADSEADYKGSTLVDLVEDIIATLPPELVKLQNPYICAFHDLIADYNVFGLNDLQSFLRWWEETGKRQIISAPEDPNAIRVMTIHKSKGLEFKCVHIPFCTWEILDFKSPAWFHTEPLYRLGFDCVFPPVIPIKPGADLTGTPLSPQYETMCNELILDELNVLYVAFTRAIDELCVHYRVKNGNQLPVGQLLGEAMPIAFPDGTDENGKYIFGKPTIGDAESTEEEEKTGSVPMTPYFTVTVPEDHELWNIDATPDAEL